MISASRTLKRTIPEVTSLSTNALIEELITHPERLALLLVSSLTLGFMGCADRAREEVRPAEHLTERFTELSAHERRVIEVFKRSSSSVAHITSVSLSRSPFDLSIHEQTEGTGTGFVWDNTGHIVTNYHVIREGDAAQVALTPPASLMNDARGGEVQRVFDARLIGVAPDRDLAVLKIQDPPSWLTPLPCGESRRLQVGQSVLAIGNPFGFDQTLTTGVISGLGREIQSVTRRKIRGVIQTDAAINPGNSGGPLLDSAGRVIGVNTAIYSPSGAYIGIGFAVPIDTVTRVVPQLLRYGGEVQPTLGVELEEGRLSERYLLPGALIVRVEAGSDADQRGLRGVRWGRRGIKWGDFITHLNGARTPDADSVYQQLDDHKIGEEVTLTLQRGLGRSARTRRVKIRLGARVSQSVRRR